MEGRLLLDVIIRQSAAIFQLLSSKDKTLLVRWDSFLVLDLGLDVLNGIRRLNLKSDGLSGEGFNEDLHTTPQTKNQMEGRLLLDVVVRQSTAIFQLLSGKDKTLLVRWDSFFVLDLSLDVLNGIRRLNLKSDGLSGKCFHEDLHTTPQTKNKMEGRLLLDVVVGQSAAIFQLLSGKDKTLLVRWDSFLVLDLGLDVLDGIGRLNLKSDGLSGEGFNKDLHTTPQTKNKMEGRLLLDVVVRQSTAIFQLLAGKDKTLLVRWDSFFVLDFSLDILNGIRRLNLKSDGLSGKGFNEDLHTTPQAKNKMEGRLLLDVVVRQSAAIFQLLAGKDKTLLVRWDSFLVLDLGLDVLDRVGRLDFKSDGLSGKCFHEDLHLEKALRSV